MKDKKKKLVRRQTYTSDDSELGITLHLVEMDFKLPDIYDTIEIRNLTDGVMLIATKEDIRWKRMDKIENDEIELDDNIQEELGGCESDTKSRRYLRRRKRKEIKRVFDKIKE